MSLINDTDSHSNFDTYLFQNLHVLQLYQMKISIYVYLLTVVRKFCLLKS
jgi:hypothetical protein